MTDHIQRLRVLRHECENDLLFFTRYFFARRFGAKFCVNTHHRKIAAHLQAVFRGEIRNLLINIPPRYTKTELAVINFIPWCLAHNPAAKFIHLSYSDELVQDNSRQIRELVGLAEYQRLWDVSLRPDAKSKRKWATDSGGGLYAVSAAGAVTGFGAGALHDHKFGGAIIIDDPMKPDDADSEEALRKINARLNSTIKSRRNSRDTPIIIIMQRLCEADMSGYVLDGGMGEAFTHLCLPALDEEGRALWPDKHDTAELHAMQAADPYGFAGQYQQRPAPEEGAFFKRGDIRFYDDFPQSELHCYGASDYAVSDGQGDFTVHGVIGVDHEDNIYVLDWWRGRTDTATWVERFLDMVKEHEPLAWAEEKGQIIKSLDPFIRKRMEERRVFCRRAPFASDKSKIARARAIQARMSMGKVFLPRGAAWVNELVNELLTFPNAKHDDQVDVMGLFGRMLAGMKQGSLPSPPGDAKPQSLPSLDQWRKQTRKKGEGIPAPIA